MSLIAAQHAAVDTAVPRALPNNLFTAAQATPVEHMPYASWERRAIGRFTYPNTQVGGPDGTRIYNMSPVWCAGDEQTVAGATGWQYLKAPASAKFEEVVALAQSVASQRDESGSWKNGSQGILQARNGEWYVTSMQGWGDEVPVRPGDPGGPAGPYNLEEVVAAGGTVQRYTPALRAVVGATTWADFSGHDAKINHAFG